MTAVVARYTKAAVVDKGWLPGTDLENQVALHLSSMRIERPVQQYRAGRYRLDFAWPQVRIALEADGWYHRSPEGAAKDRQRDSWLRSQNWVVFRVDDEHGETAIRQQVYRVCRLVRAELADVAHDVIHGGSKAIRHAAAGFPLGER